MLLSRFPVQSIVCRWSRWPVMAVYSVHSLRLKPSLSVIDSFDRKCLHGEEWMSLKLFTWYFLKVLNIKSQYFARWMPGTEFLFFKYSPSRARRSWAQMSFLFLSWIAVGRPSPMTVVDRDPVASIFAYIHLSCSREGRSHLWAGRSSLDKILWF